MSERGFHIPEGIHPIVPIMLGDERQTVRMAQAINQRGIFVVGFSYPVVPRGEARIRVQISAAHTRNQLDSAIDTFCRSQAKASASYNNDLLFRFPQRKPVRALIWPPAVKL